MKLLKKAIKVTLGVLYAPVYVLGFLLHVAARLVLGVSYIMMLDFDMGSDVIKSLGDVGRQNY